LKSPIISSSDYQAKDTRLLGVIRCKNAVLEEGLLWNTVLLEMVSMSV
jgi:hypothetical protein